MPYLIVTSVERVECGTLEEAEAYAHNISLLDEDFDCKTTFDYSDFHKEENT